MKPTTQTQPRRRLEQPTVTTETLTPIDIIHNLIEMFEAPGAAAVDRAAAIELGIILSLDASAESDLLQALFAGEKFELSEDALVQRVLDILKTFGAVEQWKQPGDSQNFGLKFHARPLIDLLARMPHRDTNNGFSQEFVQRYFGHLTQN